jgi:hypothetical protein
MNKVPGFTADASLYKTRDYYQTTGRANNSPARMADQINFAMRNEEIEVFGCAPGFLQLGEGSTMTCIPDPSWGGGGDSGGGGGGGVPAEPSGGLGGPPVDVDDATRCGCPISDWACRAQAAYNRLKHNRCLEAIEKCVSEQCEGKHHGELGKCEDDCTDIVGQTEVCLSDPCFQGIPCTVTSTGEWVCNPIPGCPGTYRRGEICF